MPRHKKFQSFYDNVVLPKIPEYKKLTPKQHDELQINDPKGFNAVKKIADRKNYEIAKKLVNKPVEEKYEPLPFFKPYNALLSEFLTAKNKEHYIQGNKASINYLSTQEQTKLLNEFSKFIV